MSRKQQPFVNPRFLTQEERDAKRKKALRKRARDNVFVAMGVILVILIVVAAISLVVIGCFAINHGLGLIAAGIAVLAVLWLLLRVAAS